jgi:hypothetical protein
VVGLDVEQDEEIYVVDDSSSPRLLLLTHRLFFGEAVRKFVKISCTAMTKIWFVSTHTSPGNISPSSAV